MSSAFHAWSVAKSFSSSVISSLGPKHSNSCRLSSDGSVKVIAGSRYSIPRCAKKSVSLVKAAFMTSGAPATIGHDAVSMTLFRPAGTCVMQGKKMYLSFLPPSSSS